MVQTRKKANVIKKKVWVTIYSPEKKELGECYVEDPLTLAGRRIKVNLMSLHNDPRKRKYNVSFYVVDSDKTSARTKICGYETQPTAIKMVIKKGHERVDDVISVKTSDGKELIVKPLYITLKNAPRSITTALRMKGRGVIKDAAKKESCDSFFSSIISQKLHKDLKAVLGKIYPLKIIEVKKCSLVMERRQEAKKNAAAETKESAPVKEESKEPAEKGGEAPGGQ
jgi:ribosomal protein S3AE